MINHLRQEYKNLLKRQMIGTLTMMILLINTKSNIKMIFSNIYTDIKRVLILHNFKKTLLAALPLNLALRVFPKIPTEIGDPL